MRVIIAGSRNITDKNIVEEAIEVAGFDITTVISGGARGVDSTAIEIARDKNIEYEEYIAEWDTFGKSAGYLRNVQMAEAADALIAIWDGESKGTKHMIDIMAKKGKDYYVYLHLDKNYLGD